MLRKHHFEIDSVFLRVSRTQHARYTHRNQRNNFPLPYGLLALFLVSQLLPVENTRTSVGYGHESRLFSAGRGAYGSWLSTSACEGE